MVEKLYNNFEQILEYYDSLIQEKCKNTIIKDQEDYNTFMESIRQLQVNYSITYNYYLHTKKYNETENK